MRLELKGLVKDYAGKRALDGIDAAWPDVHRLVLIGPSGGGKSTLLRVLAGLEIPDAGEVRLDSKALRWDASSLIAHRRSLGVVFQAFNLFPHLTALRNITLPLERVHDHSPSEALDAALAALKKFQLLEHADKKPAELSGGQQQRVAIARAVACRPRLLVFDEPTSALDPEMTCAVLDLIEELAEEGHDFILATHEMGFARLAADAIAMIANGHLIETGGPDLITNPQSESARTFLSCVLKY